MLRQTPLNALHRAGGARMVDFGGWDMPLSYGSQIEEHHKVRTNAGMFDVSHMLVLDVNGAGARDYLKHVLANNVEKLPASGKALYSCMLSPSGGIIDDLIAYALDRDWLRLVLNATVAEKDLAWLALQRDRLGSQVVLTPRRDLAIIAVQGPNARNRIWGAIPGSRAATEPLKPFSVAALGDRCIARTGYTGEDGFEIILPAADAAQVWQALLSAGVAPAGLGARDTLRLEAGMNLNGQDMDETVTPHECGLAWTVDMDAPRDFIGRDALASIHPSQHRVGLVLEAKGVLRAHQKVLCESGDGEITSGSFAPTLNHSIALARVPVSTTPGSSVRVEIRDKRLAARVVMPPFVRNGKILT